MKLVQTDNMKRISKTQFFKEFDEFVTNPQKREEGFVITEKGKDKYVICPGSMLPMCVDKDFSLIVGAAVRYSIGSLTYMPSTVIEFARKYVDLLDNRILAAVIKDIDDYYENHEETRTGVADTNKQDWLTLSDEFKTILEQRKNARQ